MTFRRRKVMNCPGPGDNSGGMFEDDIDRLYRPEEEEEEQEEEEE
jgi:hypothetical protein